MSDVKTTYREVEIKYREFDDKWNCDYFSKPANTLAEAKARIDKKLDTEKKEPFQRFKAFVQSVGCRSGRWPLVEVTSITDDGKEAWISWDGERSKISGYGQPIPIYPDSLQNMSLVAEIHRLENEKQDIAQKIVATEKKLTIWKPA